MSRGPAGCAARRRRDSRLRTICPPRCCRRTSGGGTGAGRRSAPSERRLDGCRPHGGGVGERVEPAAGHGRASGPAEVGESRGDGWEARWRSAGMAALGARGTAVVGGQAGDVGRWNDRGSGRSGRRKASGVACRAVPNGRGHQKTGGAPAVVATRGVAQGRLGGGTSGRSRRRRHGVGYRERLLTRTSARKRYRVPPELRTTPTRRQRSRLDLPAEDRTRHSSPAGAERRVASFHVRTGDETRPSGQPRSLGGHRDALRR